MASIVHSQEPTTGLSDWHAGRVNGASSIICRSKDLEMKRGNFSSTFFHLLSHNLETVPETQKSAEERGNWAGKAFCYPPHLSDGNGKAHSEKKKNPTSL